MVIFRRKKTCKISTENYVLCQWFSNFFESRHKKITKICRRHNTFINLLFVRITQGCNRYQFCLKVDFIDRYITTAYYGSLINSLRVQKKQKIRYNLYWVEIFWHIFNVLTAQYCAAAHSLRITVLCSFKLEKDPVFRICAIRMDLRVKSYYYYTVEDFL